MATPREALETRARQRAIDQDVSIFPLAGRNSREFLSQSVYSEPGAYWQLWLDDTSQPHCNCPGFTKRQSCKHVEALKMHLYEAHNREESKSKRAASIASLMELF